MIKVSAAIFLFQLSHDRQPGSELKKSNKDEMYGLKASLPFLFVLSPLNMIFLLSKPIFLTSIVLH